MNAIEKTFLLRLVVVLLCGWIALELYRITNVVDSVRLKAIGKKLCIAFVLLSLLRLLAAFVDDFLGFKSVGLFSNIINISFYGTLIGILYKYRKIFEKSEFDTSGKRRVTAIIDELLDEMRIKARSLTPYIK